MTFVKGVP